MSVTWTEGVVALGIYVMVLSLTGFLAILWDREAAARRHWRIPVQALLGLSLVGAAPGVVAARILLHHRDQPDPFTTYLRMIVIVQFTVLMVLAIPAAREWVAEFFLIKFPD